MPGPAQPTAPPARSRVGTFLRILNVRLRFILLMVLVGLISANWEGLMNHYDRWRRPARADDGLHAAQVEFYCPMHPNIVSGSPGNCPICGMPLVRRDKAAPVELPADALARVSLSPYKLRMGRIETGPVAYRMLAREIRTVGLIEYDETRRAFIAARIKGRIDKLFVNFVGQRVEKGEPLVSIYSPDLVVAQEELLAAARRRDEARDAAPLLRQNVESLLESARRKLLLWGVTPQQIDEIVARGQPETHLTIYSPIAGIVTEKGVLEGHYVNEGDDLYTIADLSDVWLQAKVFEGELSGVAVGDAVEVTSPAFPGEVFAGRITFIAFTVDPGTRTVSARVEIANPDLRLRPGMSVRAVIFVPLGKIEPIDAPAASSAAQPASVPAFDTQAVVGAYLALGQAFAADRPDDAALSALRGAAQALLDAAPPAVRTQVQALAARVAEIPGKDLSEQRRALKRVSAELIPLAREFPPGRALSVFHCPMAKASWLGVGTEVRNPYYGSEMLDCGAVTGRIAARSAETERFAMGYYCPVFPDRLFDAPRHCPIDKFPLKYVRVEKVLSIPESAVIHTGTRTVVYRESEPGVFDMVAVELGPRAGEYYPVLSGLSAGERIATRGAFLVDAESRLNPAAAGQYLGASSEHKH